MGMGMGCTRVEERVLASRGDLEGGASTQFLENEDVPFGGVMVALPALDAIGLFFKIDSKLPVLSGYYNTIQILISIAYMLLLRIKNPNRLKNVEPGELGLLLGLDRIPEARCFRKKISDLCNEGHATEWGKSLSKKWMEDNPSLVGTLYIDGHVQVYHGSLTKLPRKFVSRERLCLRGISNYWVNDLFGQPYFVVPRVVDKGMLEAIKSEIVPRLLKDIPNQPTDKELKENKFLSRFTLVFDREGYSPLFFKEMWGNHRISCITYHKFPKEDWLENEFEEMSIEMPRGETVKMKLAERGTLQGYRVLNFPT